MPHIMTSGWAVQQKASYFIFYQFNDVMGDDLKQIEKRSARWDR